MGTYHDFDQEDTNAYICSENNNTVEKPDESNQLGLKEGYDRNVGSSRKNQVGGYSAKIQSSVKNNQTAECEQDRQELDVNYSPTIEGDVRLVNSSEIGMSSWFKLSRNSLHSCQLASDILYVLELNRLDVIYEDVINYLNILTVDDPKTYDEAMNGPNAKEWQKATDIEYDNLRRRGVLKEIRLTPERSIRTIGTKLVFKTKIKNNKIDKFKVRLVAKGFTQKMWDDYNETFAPVARMNSLRIFLKTSLDYNH
jgi:hypothetical protein